MKIFFCLLFIASQSFASISMVIIERNLASSQDTFDKNGNKTVIQHAESFTAKAYGLLPNGACKFIPILGSDLKKISAIENCEIFNLKRDVIREIIYFDADCKPSKIDFHMGENFEVKSFNEFDNQSEIAIGNLEGFLESQ